MRVETIAARSATAWSSSLHALSLRGRLGRNRTRYWTPADKILGALLENIAHERLAIVTRRKSSQFAPDCEFPVYASLVDIGNGLTRLIRLLAARVRHVNLGKRQTGGIIVSPCLRATR